MFRQGNENILERWRDRPDIHLNNSLRIEAFAKGLISDFIIEQQMHGLAKHGR